MAQRQIIVAITGASGAPYARRLLQVLQELEVGLHVVASDVGRGVYRMETGRFLEDDLAEGIRIYREGDFWAPIASGSTPVSAMVIVPCSMGTLAAVAHGISQNLIHRAADVCLKENRRLVLVPRETPLNRVHLANMLMVHQAGAIVLPPMPGFYHRPRSLEEVIDFVAGRILDQLGLPHELVAPWNCPDSPP